MTRAGAGALFIITDALMLERRVSDIVALALKHRLPAMYPWRTWVWLSGRWPGDGVPGGIHVSVLPGARRSFTRQYVL